MLTAYLAHPDFRQDLLDELGDKVTEVYDRLVLTNAPRIQSVWADNIWLNPQIIEISSIGDAAQKLKALQRNWANYAFDFHRRSELIAEKLPHVSAKPIKFPSATPTAPLGSWTLIDNNRIVASPSCSSAYANGAYLFEENKTEAPSRAYLKLWEILTRLQKFPKAGETCIDLGACPGGWTWVLQGLGASVISVDKAPLAPHIAALPRIRYIGESAFALKPETVGRVDWLVSDIICYPDRALRLMQTWKESGLAKNMISTIKFQGKTDREILGKFMEIPGSSIYHLYNNKHEVTWVNLDDQA